MSIAEKMAANQKQVAISEFFEKNKHFLGFDTLNRALITAVKEHWTPSAIIYTLKGCSNIATNLITSSFEVKSFPQ